MDSDATARQRFHSFKMGGSTSPTFARHSHGRSRSRNNSISLSASAPSLSPSAPDSPPLNPYGPPKRPTSHHRRCSSVSTRHESAELMGMSLPELPPAHSDDNINLGDRDSIRRRALWALEGKPDLAFSKVEIPDMHSPDAVNKPFEFPTKPSFPPGLNGFVQTRDSFGKMFGSKDQLGTLLEEEEEEEDKDKDKEDIQPPADEQCKEQAPAKSSTRHRPASLNLRPLSLVHSTVVSAVSGNLPTPTQTPGSRPYTRKPDAAANIKSTRRFSYTCNDSVSAPCDLDKKRRSSISYKRSSDSIPRDMIPLPTPEMTPIEHRFSLASEPESLAEQPLSVADQHFLFRSHHVLLSRITELERTLKNQAPRSHHISYASEVSVPVSGPSDEMLQLISDLRTERDELKRDIEGWRQRVADADKQASMLVMRIESERREVWVARSRLGLLEGEKSGLEKSLNAKAAALSQSIAENQVLTRERDAIKDEVMRLNARLKDAEAAVDECTRLRAALEQERVRRKELEKLLDDAGLLNTPKLAHSVKGSWRRPPFRVKPIGTRSYGLGFQSVDSESSTTDAESLDDSFTKAELTLDAVAEEEVEFSDEDNGLAGYEDEEDSDLSFSSPTSSSIGSADELDIKHKAPVAEANSVPSHQSRASLSKTWTFPRGKTTAHVKQDDEVDRFFGCLDDGDKSPPLSVEITQSAFSSAFDDEESPPFFIPSDIGVVVDSTSLDAVPEEDEADDDDELVGEEVEGGIRFTFNAPPIICVTPPVDVCATPPPEIHITPPMETPPAVRSRSSRPICTPELDDEDENAHSLAFVFPPKGRLDHASSPPRPSPPSSDSSSRPSSRNDRPPSSIPRAVSLRSMYPKTPPITFTPSKCVSGRSACPALPSKKQSSIPQLVASSKFYSPQTSKQSTPNVNDPLSSTQSGGATSVVNSSSNVCEYLHAQDTLPSLSSIMSNPLAARSPFQKLSHFIPFSWTPGATAVASYFPSSNSGNPSVEATVAAASLSNGTTHPAQQRFVSKARQLEKLRSRFSLEKKGETTPCSMVGACKGCSSANVYL